MHLNLEYEIVNLQKTFSHLCLVADGSVNEDVVITKPFGNGRMTCREIRRNSAGCLKFRDECQKCKDIQHIGKITLRKYFILKGMIIDIMI